MDGQDTETKPSNSMSPSRQLAAGDFQKQLAFGQLAETDIARWLLAQGRTLLPIYDIEYPTGKGPRLFTKGRQIVAPDLLVWGPKGLCWIEAKHKTVFSWHGTTRRWTTGIDKRHWNEYLHVRDRLSIPVWLLFLHSQSTPDRKDIARFLSCPPSCPVGLFGEEISTLKHTINHHCAASPSGNGGWGRSGMVYWAHETLRLLASLEEVSRRTD